MNWLEPFFTGVTIGVIISSVCFAFACGRDEKQTEVASRSTIAEERPNHSASEESMPMNELIRLAYLNVAASALDSRHEATRIFWRKKLGFSADVVHDSRPLREIAAAESAS